MRQGHPPLTTNHSPPQVRQGELQAFGLGLDACALDRDTNEAVIGERGELVYLAPRQPPSAAQPAAPPAAPPAATPAAPPAALRPSALSGRCLPTSLARQPRHRP